ncbi:histidine phosphatase family protein [Lignipirellula cremea]|uniref:Phosphoserine phosphatase 1 n=1 Tax=Lignipirellula cremea TaxID=2528010 RepID=A0A518DWW8_9BACT|nr:histidine phosphatase family protein [Lignipirellula cremea]QDU96336.1 Phosphoserine phosphatase 1 [Lignipirellula cremea]
MLRIVLVHPGATDFDEQRRIKGTLDLPLSDTGTLQVAQTTRELSELAVDCIYAAPCKSAMKTAEALAEQHRLPVRQSDKLLNLNHGLWQGKRIDEVKMNQPRVYKQCQEHPETVCPPQGETLESATLRVRRFLDKLQRKHKKGVVAVVLPEPLLSLMRSCLNDREMGDLWKAECDNGGWEVIDVLPQKSMFSWR